MKTHDQRLSLGVASFVLCATVLIVELNCDADSLHQQDRQQSQSQRQSQQQPPPSSPAPSSQAASEPAPPIGELPIKRRKVWTNDDVVSLRSPADNYELDEEAKKVADAKAAAKEAAIRAAIKSEKEPPLDIKLPATVEETEKMLNNTRDDVQEETDILDKLHKELQEAPAEEQPQKQKEIDRLAALLEKSQEDLKALQDHLQTLRGKSPEENPPAPPPTQPPTA